MIERVAAQYRLLLESVVTKPAARIGELEILSYAERQQLLTAFNDTKIDYPNNSCIHHLFEVKADEAPDVVALIFEGERQLSYGELNARANQLAHFLMGRGIGAESRVGVMMERSAEMVVGLLGILKAGAAYLPLDPSYPARRLAFMMEDAAICLLLTQQSLAEAVPERRCEAISIDAQWRLISVESEQNPVSSAVADNLAYIIYTSGLTGEPKGIGIPHKAVNRLVCNTNYIELGPEDIVAQAANASFDAATFEIWGALLQGARLVGVGKDEALSPRDFVRRLKEEEINTAFITTALFNQMAAETGSAFSSLRNVLFGGQAVDPRWVGRVIEEGRPERLLHVYGPTESTTFASWHEAKEVSEGAETIPIGRPISNTETYVLDNKLQVSAIGVPGELYIGGEGLARGYVNRAEMTAEKFVPAAYGEEAGKRLYRSGDLVRYKTDGDLEFLGRMDHQVKIRGYRIELGEIEAVLRCHPGVGETVVLAREDEPGEKRLVAYVVSATEQPEGAERGREWAAELKSYLSERLPEYMTPAAIVELERLPLTANGKVDRKALPAPVMMEELGEGEEARTAVEEIIAGIWAEVLRLEQVGVKQNFFELGGHSLSGDPGRLASAGSVGSGSALRVMFERPTVADLAEAVEKARGLGVERVRSSRRRGKASCRCRMRSSGCGSSINWSRGARPITSRRLCD